MKIPKRHVYAAFFYILVVLTIFREEIPVRGFYIKALEAYVGLTLPASLPLLIRKWHRFSRSAWLLAGLFTTWLVMNAISGLTQPQYITHEESLLYYLRLGLLVYIAILTLEGVLIYYSLVDIISQAFVAGSVLLIVWAIAFPEYKTSLQRLTGPLGDPNYSASYLIVGLNVALYKALTACKVRTRLLSFILSGLFLTSIVYSLSRGGMLGAIISLTLLLLVVALRRNKRRYFNRAALILYLLLFLGMLAMVLFNDFTTLLVQRLSLENIVAEKDQQRWTMWQFAVTSIANNPIGYGMGQMRRKIRAEDPYKLIITDHSTEAHNLVLQIGGAFGWLGLLSALVFLSYLLRVCSSLLRLDRSIEACLPNVNYTPLVTSLIGLFAQAMFFNFLYIKHFWLLIGIVLAVSEYISLRYRIACHSTGERSVMAKVKSKCCNPRNN